MPTRAPRRRPTSCGGLRPTSAARLAQTLQPDGGDETLKKGHPNPFKADHAQFIKEQRQRSGTGGNAGRGGVQRANSAVRNMRQRQREQTTLQALERIEDKHTADRAVQVLEEVIEGSNSIEELRWFLRLAYDSKRPLVSVKARREQLLLLQSVVRRARTLGGEDSLSQAMTVLKERVLPLLVNALKCGELQESVVDTLHDILDCHVPDDTPEAACEGFLQASRVILQALLDPLALGTGWDFSVKRRCVTTLAALTPELLRKARLAVGSAPSEGDEVRKLLNVFAQLLVHSLEVSSELHEGLLQCLAELAADEAGRAGFRSQMARELAERCASHLAETPSAAPQYLPEALAEGGRSESPPARGKVRQELTRELAMVCCLCLRSLGEGLVQQDDTAEGERASIELPQLKEKVLAALSRDNLNLQRLTRGHEPLRKSIGAARHVWEDLEAATDQPEPPASQAARRPTSRNRGVASALAMRELLDAQPEPPARPYRGRSPGRGNQNRGSSPGLPARPARATAAIQARGSQQAGRDMRNGHGELQAKRDQSLFSSDGEDAAMEEVYVHGGYEEQPFGDEQAMMPTIHPSLLDEENGLEAPGLEIQPAAQTSQSWNLEAAPAVVPEVSREGPGVPQDRNDYPLQPIGRVAWSEQEPPQSAGPMPRRKPASEAGQVPPGAIPVNNAGRPPRAGSPTKEASQAGRMPQKTAGPTSEATHSGRMPAGAVGFLTEAPPGPDFLPQPEAALVAPQMLFPPVALTPDDSPIFAVVLDYLAAGRVDMGLQHIFQAGNERTLRALLQRLDSGETWPQLTLPVAQHLARLLVALLCRNPRSSGASEACAWIEGLLRSSRRQPEALMPRDELQALQGALFDLSGMGGASSTCAARVYYRLFHQVGQQALPVAPGLYQGLGQVAPRQGFALPASSLQAACA
eukprot:TRINITY_DN73963_c0_g1_i1.p1 TRINITY_DN73963_c0_g1~~TRINITY_DN73963_c0_g1_i1.p1  ORF type:complete len:925 (+),score=160.93 TRINITY_DN73963_c0_g1_i1:30-2804(+)